MLASSWPLLQGRLRHACTRQLLCMSGKTTYSLHAYKQMVQHIACMEKQGSAHSGRGWSHATRAVLTRPPLKLSDHLVTVPRGASRPQGAGSQDPARLVPRSHTHLLLTCGRPIESGMSQSLLKFFRSTSTGDEPPAKQLCSESRETQTDLQEEGVATEEACKESPSSDCPESTSSSARSMSSKQSRRFRKPWLVGRKQWLEYSRQDHGMFCSLCQRFNKRPFNDDVWSD